jgi:hypothetical protein
MAHHPNLDYVLAVIESFLDERVFKGWGVEGIHFDFPSHSYDLVCTNGDVSVTVRLLCEWIDEAASGEHFKRRHIKHVLKDAFRIQIDPED